MSDFDDLPRAEFAFPGPLRDQLIEEMRNLPGDPSFMVDDDTVVVLERFRVVTLA